MSESTEASAPAAQPPSIRDYLAQAILCSEKRPSLPVVPISEQDIMIVQQKVASTIDELVDNNDYKVSGMLIFTWNLPLVHSHNKLVKF